MTASPDPQPHLLFDRRAWRLHRARAQRAGAVDFLHREVGDRLLDRLDAIAREFPIALDLGAGDLALARALAERPGTHRVVAAEPAASCLEYLCRHSRECGNPGTTALSPALDPRFRGGDEESGGDDGAPPSEIPVVAADPEFVPFRDTSFDLAISNLVLHWAADLPGVLVQLRRVLRPDGLLLASMFGGQTLVELRTALFEAELAEEGGVSPRVSPAIELADAASLLQRAGLAMPVADSETLTVTYPDMRGLMRDLRGMGETNALTARRRGFLRRATLARASAIYAERFAAADGRIAATFEILFLTGWAPHPGHHQPRPGPRRRIG